MTIDPPIRIGSIVRVGTRLGPYTGIIIESTTYEPGFREIQIPGIGVIEVVLEKCYNATEAERKEYFKNVLKHGED